VQLEVLAVLAKLLGSFRVELAEEVRPCAPCLMLLLVAAACCCVLLSVAVCCVCVSPFRCLRVCPRPAASGSVCPLPGPRLPRTILCACVAVVVAAAHVLPSPPPPLCVQTGGAEGVRAREITALTLQIRPPGIRVHCVPRC
jgi:hypothetical protein